MSTNLTGKTILGYTVVEEIGSGGFGTVYKVSKKNAAGEYIRALKHMTIPTKKQYNDVLNSMGGDYSKADDYFASVLKDIVNEIRILSSLSESGIKNIVSYYENDIVETESPKMYNIYILMEYLTPFTDYITERQITVRDVIKLGKDILTALISCHEQNVIHRDIKDDNIFVANDGAYKLGDFGVSKSLKDKSKAESIKGTPNYIAPEVYLGKEKYDKTVDLYSLGIVLYKYLNYARNPFLPDYPAAFTSADEEQAFEKRMSGEIPSLPCNAKNALGEAVLKAIKPRAQRYNSAEEFLAELCTAEVALDDEYLNLPVGLAVRKTSDATAVAEATTIATPEVSNETLVVDSAPVQPKVSSETVVVDSAPVQPKASSETVVVDSAPVQPKVSNETVVVDSAPVQPKASNETVVVDSAPVQPKVSNETVVVDSAPVQPKASNETVVVDSASVVKKSKDETVIVDNAPITETKKTEKVEENPMPSTSAVVGGVNSGRVTDKEIYEQTKDKERVASIVTFTLPFVFAALYLAFYVIFIPALYGKMISWASWLIADAEHIQELFSDANNILYPMYKVVLLIGTQYLLLGLLLVSIYRACKRLHNMKKKIVKDATYIGKDPYADLSAFYMEHAPVAPKQAREAFVLVRNTVEALKFAQGFGMSKDEEVQKLEKEIGDTIAAMPATYLAISSDEGYAEWTEALEEFNEKVKSRNKMLLK